MAQITGKEIQEMVRHWIETPVCGYLGSNYGQDANALLQRPSLDGAPEAYLNKMRSDIPVLQALPAGSLNLYGVHTPPDRFDLVIEVAGMAIPIGGS